MCLNDQFVDSGVRGTEEILFCDDGLITQKFEKDNNINVLR